MSIHPVSIIGAGISGLALGRSLLQRGISAVLYERDSYQQATTRHNYAITLYQSAYRPLLDALRLDEAAFKRELAVDSTIDGEGPVGLEYEVTSFRANRRRLEEVLREGLDVRWEHQLASLTPAKSPGHAPKMVFGSGDEVHSKIVVGADGPHSQLRKHISPSSTFNILPYAVYNGKRRLGRAEFDQAFAPHMKGSTVLEQQTDGTLLQISLSDINNKTVSISYTYSRHAQRPDPLFTSDRSNASAKIVPEAIFTEVGSLTTLQPPFDIIFEASAMRKDRLLNWLMRSVHVPQPGLKRAAAEEGLVLIGDAAHHSPILGSWGANEGIADAIELAEIIAERGLEGLGSFYERRSSGWVEQVRGGEARLARMHGDDVGSSRL